MFKQNMSPYPVEENFGRWSAAIVSKNPENVVALYADALTLLPTLSPRTITNHEGAKEYFIFFLGLEPEVSMVEEHVVPISDESYLHCGVYKFQLGQGDARGPVNARFSFVWHKEGDTWKILHHHSSGVPVRVMG